MSKAVDNIQVCNHSFINQLTEKLTGDRLLGEHGISYVFPGSFSCIGGGSFFQNNTAFSGRMAVLSLHSRK